jgi:hypothetical protein
VLNALFAAALGKSQYAVNTRREKFFDFAAGPMYLNLIHACGIAQTEMRALVA